MPHPSTHISSALPLLKGGGFLGCSPTLELLVLPEKPQARSLRQLLLQRDRPTYAHQVQILTQLCRVLGQAHNAGLLHNGLCPEAILISQTGEVFLGDWQHSDSPGASLPPFMPYSAPEIARKASSEIDPRSDLFSLGVLWYELLCGQRPFSAETPLALLKATLSGQPPAPRALFPEIPEEISSLCLALLSPDPKERPSSAVAVIYLLQSYLDSLGKDSAAHADTPWIGGEAKHSAEASTFPEAPLSTTLTAQAGLNLVPQSAYEIKGELARGGLGKILRAFDRRLGRSVALKEILRDRGDTRERFLREALITARLQHPSIVPIYEAGQWPTGELFYSMKLVSGKPLHEVIAQAQTLNERLALLPHMIAASEAVAYAHSEKILHRDLKPHNILAGEFGETIVIDWGLAKDLREKEERLGEAGPYRANAGEGLTLEGSVLGTPAYMPPEQAQGKPVDQRADVYSLGAILYHILSGVVPYQGDSSRSTLLQVLQGAPVPLVKRAEGIPRDLIAIVEKAMAREASERYPSAKELVDDLKKFQAGNLVSARYYTQTERLRRWVSQHRMAVLAGSVALLALVSAGAFAFYNNAILAEKLSLTEKEKMAAQQEKLAAEDQRKKAEAREAEAKDKADELRIEEARTWAQKDPRRALQKLSELSDLFPKEKWETARFLAADALAQPSPKQRVRGVLFAWASPDGARITLLTKQGELIEYETSSGKKLDGRRTLKDYQNFTKTELWVLSPDQQRLAAVDQKDNSVWLWSTATGEGGILEERPLFTNAPAFSPDSQALLLFGGGSTLRLWNLNDKSYRDLPSHSQYTTEARFSPDGKLIAAHGNEAKILLIGVTDDYHREISDGSIHRIGALEFSPDGRYLAYLQKTMYVYDFTLQKNIPLQTPPNTEDVRFSPDSQQIICTSEGASWVWEVARLDAAPTPSTSKLLYSTSGEELTLYQEGFDIMLLQTNRLETQQFSLPGEPIERLELVPSKKQLFLLRGEDSFELWDIPPLYGDLLSEQIATSDYGKITPAAFSPDGRRLAFAKNTGEIYLHPLGSDQATSFQSTIEPFSLSFSPNGEFLAVGGKKGAELWDLSTKEAHPLAGHQNPVNSVAFSPDSSLLVTASVKEGEIFLWSLPDRRAVPLKGNLSGQGRPLFSPSGEWLTLIGSDGVVHLWRISDGRPGDLQLLQSASSVGLAIAFSPDSKTLAAAGIEDLVRLWDLPTLSHQDLSSGISQVQQVQFSLDGARLFAAGKYGIASWNTKNWEKKFLTLKDHAGRMALSPDQKTIALGAANGMVLLVNTELTELRALSGHINTLASPVIVFSPDGKQLISTGSDSKLFLWDNSLPYELGALQNTIRTKLQRE